MRATILLATAVLSGSYVSAMAGPPGHIDQGAGKAEDCLACHNAMVSLKGRGTEVIVEQINAIRAGGAAHPPGLAALNEADIAEIAAYLDVAD